MKKAKLVYGKSYIFEFFFWYEEFFKKINTYKNILMGFLDKYFFLRVKAIIPLIYIK